MAFGFPAKHSIEIPLEGLDPEQFIQLAKKAVQELNWNLQSTSELTLTARTGFSMKSWGEELSVVFDNGFVRLTSKCSSTQIVDYGKNKKNIESFLEMFDKVKSWDENKGVEDAEAIAPTSGASVMPAEEELAQHTQGSFMSMFLPAKNYFVTPVLVWINILVFVLMVISGVSIFEPGTEDLLTWGGNFRPSVVTGEWWRLLTSCFIHIGIIHLLMNMYALVYIGVLLEPILGKTKFIAAYFITGLLSGITSLWWHDLTVSAGASGAIFGMYGVFLALLTTRIIPKASRKDMLASIGLFVGYNLLLGLRAGVDNAAHIGGLVSGLVIGYGFIPSLKKDAAPHFKWITIGAAVVMVYLATYIIPAQAGKDLAKWESEMTRFTNMERMAMQVFNMRENEAKSVMLDQIEGTGLYFWNENKELVKNFKDLDLPPHIQQLNRKLIQYCDLRIKSYELWYKAVEEETTIYDDQILKCNQQIEKLVSEMKPE